MELGPLYPWCWPSKYFSVATGLKNPCCKLFHFFDCVLYILFFLFLIISFEKCETNKKKIYTSKLFSVQRTSVMEKKSRAGWE